MLQSDFTPSFENDKLYYSTLNREAVQGSILSRHQVNPAGWYEVISLTPLILLVEGPGRVQITEDVDPHYAVRSAIYRWQVAQGLVTPKRRTPKRDNGKPKKSINYAAQVVAR